MAGRARGVSVSTTSVVLANRSLDRQSITFSVGDTTNASSVILKDEEDATATNGFPLGIGVHLTVTGKAARHRWSAIRLAAVDCVVGVLEGYSDNFFDGASTASDGEPK